MGDHFHLLYPAPRDTPAMGLHLDVVPGPGKHLCCRQDNPTQLCHFSCTNFTLHMLRTSVLILCNHGDGCDHGDGGDHDDHGGPRRLRRSRRQRRRRRPDDDNCCGRPGWCFCRDRWREMVVLKGCSVVMPLSIDDSKWTFWYEMGDLRYLAEVWEDISLDWPPLLPDSGLARGTLLYPFLW